MARYFEAISELLVKELSTWNVDYSTATMFGPKKKKFYICVALVVSPITLLTLNWISMRETLNVRFRKAHEASRRSQEDLVLFPAAAAPAEEGRNPPEDIPDLAIMDYHLQFIQTWGFNYTPEQLEEKRRGVSKIYSQQTFNLTLLPNYKNPCWYEPIQPSYTCRKNLLMKQGYASCSSSLKKLEKQWKGDYKARRKTQRLRCLPYLYLAGMPKSGTTDMFDALKMHPNISGSLAKEPHWWTKRAYGFGRTKYVIPFKHYVDIFDVAASRIEDKSIDDFHPMVTLEGSPSTAEFEEPWPLYPENRGLLEPVVTAAHHIRGLTPDARILITLRNPTDRLYSHFMFESAVRRIRFGTPEGFHRCVVKGLEEIRQCLEARTLRQCTYNWTLNFPARTLDKLTIKTGFYFTFINDWFKVFPREQIKVIRFEDYADKRGPALDEIFEFLDVGPLPTELQKHANNKRVSNHRGKKYRAKGDMLNSTRLLLDDFYRPYNEMLAELLHDERFLWERIVH